MYISFQTVSSSFHLFSVLFFCFNYIDFCPYLYYFFLLFALVFIIVVQSPSRVQLFATPWTAACQASLSFTFSQSFLKLMSIESVVPSNHFILCCPLLLLPSTFPSIWGFPMSQLFTSGGQSIGASASVLPMNIQD